MSKYPDRIGVCFDTCHVFAAGYNLCTEADYNQTFEHFDQIIGLDRLIAFHLNDAKSAYNSRVDRHDHIGEGNLGIPPFQRLVTDSRFENVPAIIETPKMKEMHATNLAVLRKLQAG
jgi:deoxyribonuclease-4